MTLNYIGMRNIYCIFVFMIATNIEIILNHFLQHNVEYSHNFHPYVPL